MLVHQRVSVYFYFLLFCWGDKSARWWLSPPGIGGRSITHLTTVSNINWMVSASLGFSHLWTVENWFKQIWTVASKTERCFEHWSIRASNCWAYCSKHQSLHIQCNQEYLLRYCHFVIISLMPWQLLVLPHWWQSVHGFGSQTHQKFEFRLNF